jgi:hypothetical protein
MRLGLVVSVLVLTLAAAGCQPARPSAAALADQATPLRSQLTARLEAGDGQMPPAADLAAEREMLTALRSVDTGAATILDAPSATTSAEAAPVVAGDVQSGQPAPARVRWWQTPHEDGWWQKPLADRSFFEVVKDDGYNFPREFMKSGSDCINVPSGLVLAGAAILSVVSRDNWDHHVDKSMLYDFSPKSNFFSKSDHLGDNLGNPVAGWGIAMLCYGWSVETKNDEFYGFSKALMQALILDDIATPALKAATHENSPNHEDHYDWPSGHTSSTATMAAVAWDYYGPAAGVPLYLFSGFVGVSMMHERQHWLSDVIFGEVLGTVIGHSVASNRLLKAGGFTVVPYAAGDGGGVMFVKEF